MRQDIESILLSEEKLKQRVLELGQEISRDFSGRELLVVGILKGSIVFMADLLRIIDIPVTIDFMAVSSYGAGTSSSGDVRIIKDLDSPVEGRHILIVEDILDSGKTLSYIMNLMAAGKPASVQVCALLDKPDRRVVQVDCRYKGFSVPDAFVVGYGLDYAERYRNLPYIGILHPSVYNAP